MHYYKRVNPFRFLIYFCLLLLMHACTKVNVTFEDDDKLNDPDISYFDTYEVDISTYKIDSFKTSGTSVFMLGTHFDTSFAKYTAESYAEVAIPAENTVKDKEVVFDSIVLVLTPNGNYYGDTTLPLKLSIFKLGENIANEDEDDDNYYYPRKFIKEINPIAQATIGNLRPKRGKEITIRLPDNLGQDLLRMLNKDRDTIQTQEDFREYLKGFCIVPDSNFCKSIFYFNAGIGGQFMRLHYKERNTFLTEKQISFGFVTNKQFNHISYNRSVTPFSIFQPYKKQVKMSSQMGNKAYLSNLMPSFIKLTFPSLQSLKERYPFVRIVKAVLEIKPAPGTSKFPYTLPEQFRMYISNTDENYFDAVLTDATNSFEQNGGLVIDDLYGKDTRYSFDISAFLNTVLNEGRYSTKSLLLVSANSFTNETQRLVINEQQSKDGIKLKLYVLGL